MSLLDNQVHSKMFAGGADIKVASTDVLLGGLTASVIASFVNNGVNMQLITGTLDTLLTVGAPTAVGILAVNALEAGEDSTNKLVSSVLAGGIAVALMISVGALPATVDMQTMGLVAICAGGAYVGDNVASWFA